MASRGAIQAGKAFVELGVRDKMARGLRRAQARLKAFGASVGQIGARLATIGTVAAGAMLGAAKVFASVGDEVAKMSRRTGVSVETLSELKFVASQTGTEFGTLEGAFRKMQRSIYDAGRGLSTQVDAFEDLGLSFKDFDGLSPEKQFKLLADHISGVEDPTKRAAIAMSLLGRSGTALLPMFEKGAAGIDALQKKARGLGLTISAEDAAKAEEFTDTMDVLGRVVKMGIFHVGAALAPVLKQLAEAITGVVAKVSAWIQQNQQIIVTALKVAATVLAAGVAMMIIGKVISSVGVIIGVFTIALKALAVVIGILTSPVALVVVALGALAAAFAYVSLRGETLGEKLSHLWTIIKSYVAPALVWLKSAVTTAFAAVGFAVENWQNVMKFALVSAAYGVVKFGNQMKHFFTKAIPGYLGWFKNNWRDIFQTIWNGTKAIFSNMSKNIGEFFKAVWKWMKGEGWDFKWTGLLDGFESTIKEMPKIARREIGPVEKELSDMMDKIGGDLNQSWGEYKKKYSRGAIATPEAPKVKDASDGIKKAADALGQVAKRTFEARGTFQASQARGLGAGGAADRTAKATEETAKNTRKIATATQRGGLTFS